ncbi:MAG: YbcC family protein [Planctomycetota bacterium]|jgi:uncharacterized protein YbcC (UPF0753/DUF2309 family)
MTTLAPSPIHQFLSGAIQLTPVEDSNTTLDEVLQKVQDTVAPVWPLQDYVAVNPFLGMTGQSFLKTRRFLQLFSDCESLMPLSYYRSLFEQGRFTTDDIHVALYEMAIDGQAVAALLTVEEVLDVLEADQPDSQRAVDSKSVEAARRSGRRMELLSEVYDRFSRSNWTTTFLDETSRCCATHYDDGQAAWQSPWKDQSLYQAWRSAALHNRRVEVLGLRDFRKFVSQLPQTADDAIASLLRQLKVPVGLWESVLQCTAFSMPGWSAWCKYQTQQAERSGGHCDDFVGLLAIRLAYEGALSTASSFHCRWACEPNNLAVRYQPDDDDSLVRYVLLRASEVASRSDLVMRLSDSIAREKDPETSSVLQFLRGEAVPEDRPSAQMVFCIDVRSERFRRQLEATNGSVETFGFAGFFGVPIEFEALGESGGSSQVPALLTPQYRVREGIRGGDADTQSQATNARRVVRSLRKVWKGFQTSAAGCFGFVESAGWVAALKLFRKSAGLSGTSDSCRHDGIDPEHHDCTAPSLEGLAEQGLTIEAQAEMAAGILRGIGITDTFARLVVFCGHGSQTENNPLQAGLECGACGGHSGEPNARFAAAVLNQPAVRDALVDHGIAIPSDVHFVAAQHNTTNDELSFFDVDAVPDSHRSELNDLKQSAKSASAQTRGERLSSLDAANVRDVFRRTEDWSEVRPEWGLTGNAAFIVAPRLLTRSIDLDGRAFLHSYDFRKDIGYQVLEQIMTAPMIVTHWINMQYYASTVDNEHFGSGSKTIHNVVGQFGVFSGNGGDLTTGLPWQSLHNGTELQHEPLRLQVVIAAPKSAIDDIVAKHSLLDDLLTNDWLSLIALDEGTAWRYSAIGGWQALSATEQDCELTAV